MFSVDRVIIGMFDKGDVFVIGVVFCLKIFKLIVRSSKISRWLCMLCFYDFFIVCWGILMYYNFLL